MDRRRSNIPGNRMPMVVNWFYRESGLTVTLIVITLLVLVFLGFDLLLNDLLHQARRGTDLETLHSLFVTRGIVITGLIAMWGWYLVRWRYAKLDKAMRRWEDFYAEQSNLLREPILFLDLAGKLLQWNEAAGQQFGDARLAKGEVDPSLVEEEQERLLDFLEQMRSGPISLQSEQRQIDLVCTDHSGNRLTMTHHVSVIRDLNQVAAGFIVLKVNIVPVLEEAGKLATLEKYAAIGNMTSAIAHQLNTPLNSILLSIEMLGDSYPNIETEELGAIKSQVGDCREHVRRLLRLARDPAYSSGRQEPFCLYELVDFLASMYQRVLKTHGIRLRHVQEEAHLCENCNLVGDKYAVRQALMNLIGNAADVLGDTGGRIDVRCGFIDGEARISVRDNGSGIAPETLEKIWEPFFTTKETGTGLGLAVTRRIVTDLGGRIEVDSNSTGTEFRLFFPNAGSHGDGQAIIKLDDIGLNTQVHRSVEEEVIL